ncbi:MAG: 3-deoxy-7-phosphoheptulonate synthase class II [Candidatus Neomarinimicrobiota bacterium]|jgi:3-deoxy-7-phosphoheptulonate synthase|nr:3-deoxy-7-phosphoheptulonate synthase class II [Candidatus Neomarinimicrobiota bacterium]MEC8706249.1 3-deoxy-7-phosphoheptulonate synthase class II [Candidatus Neomarinimicrobiota bacterium]|tara:strand:- start:1720 stop:3054 length:1335 start_codon:yes stop_codon:yes gene_type:complete
MWKLDSWKQYEALHLPTYKDDAHLNEVLNSLKGFPPLVFAGEVRSLRKSLAKVAEGEGFLLQGGDCAESFSEFNADNIRDTFRVILQMAVILTSGTNLPVVKVGRMAGQFAKPRSSTTEIKNNVELESYKGDIINGIEFDQLKREPDPERMLKAYSQAASTLNLLRAFADGGYADLRFVNSWNMGFLKSGEEYKRYRDLAGKIQESLNFMEALGVNSINTPQLRKTDYYTCHEALLLPYEEALTRTDSTTGDIYDTSAHFVWIGDRTRFENSAHVEFCSGIQNPIGIKCGPSVDYDELIKIIDKLNPNNDPGRITLIARYGNDRVEKYLPKLIKQVQNEGRSVVWSCDPMHGNTIKSSEGTKTRPFSEILSEVKKNIQIHDAQGSWFGGIHLEMTGQNVTECTGGIDEISESELKDRYHTHCDPRLNANQAIELAFLISDELKN